MFIFIDSMKTGLEYIHNRRAHLPSSKLVLTGTESDLKKMLPKNNKNNAKINEQKHKKIANQKNSEFILSMIDPQLPATSIKDLTIESVYRALINNFPTEISHESPLSPTPIPFQFNNECSENIKSVVKGVISKPHTITKFAPQNSQITSIVNHSQMDTTRVFSPNTTNSVFDINRSEGIPPINCSLQQPNPCNLNQQSIDYRLSSNKNFSAPQTIQQMVSPIISQSTY